MARELSQQQLEEMVVGKPGRPNVVFFDKPVLDRQASDEAGRRIYVDQVMVKKSFPDVRDWVAERAQPKDFQLYPEEYERYLQTRKGTTSPGIEILPNLEPIHRQELIDYGIATIEQLVNTETIPHHLQYAKDSAGIMYAALKEVSNGRQEEDQQEDSVEIQDEIQQAGAVPPPSGRELGGDVGRSSTEALRADPGGEAPRGVHQGGREHGHQGLNADFSIEVTYG